MIVFFLVLVTTRTLWDVEPKPVAPREGDAARQPFESLDAGDFEKDQPFSFGAWVKIPKEGATGWSDTWMVKKDTANVNCSSRPAFSAPWADITE